MSFSLTPEDAEFFQKLADDLGFTSRPAMFTGIMERLRLGGMAPACFFRVGLQLAKLAQKSGLPMNSGLYNPFSAVPSFELREKPRPEPVLADEGMAAQEITQALKVLKHQLQNP